MKVHPRYSPLKTLDLFAWADTHHETRRPLPPIVHRIAYRGRISLLHARAFAEANAIGAQVSQ